ncbi:uracil-DNA glycosylase [Marinicella sp. S1101]|uniref:uracil-DNA glycosylase n=1 Tax=Marinicella marina TaxID=2996016 RepID=UPI002260F395|nr:uracil-DNA glycosylase [Marinicella marina]MCX7553912.1 uracil-DNA glycosylase [Marinicella marina]MDJ1140404.1 uracil-DNA glycosylase [Marinicella marina]
MQPQIDASWLQHLETEFQQPYIQDLKAFLLEQKQAGKVIFPPGSLIFNALNSTPLDQVKVVILGQDPYHGPGQAHGLSFSVPDEVKIPPSLRNIFKELAEDLGVINHTGNLQSWANQGVLLLNSVLTVEQAQAGSHQGRGWERFTDRIIHVINEQRKQVVFMLWGSYAQKKGAHIDTDQHLILKAPHPSPLSAHRGFLGCQHFSKCNEFLKSQKKSPINWQI